MSESEEASFSGEEDNLPSPILRQEESESDDEPAEESSKNLTYTEEEGTASDEDELGEPVADINKNLKSVKSKKISSSTPLPAKISAAPRKRHADPNSEPSGETKKKMVKPTDANQKKENKKKPAAQQPVKKTNPIVFKSNSRYKEMVMDAITDNSSRTGISLRSIEKFVKAKFNFANDKMIYLKKAVKALIKDEVIYNYKGIGLNGSFKIKINKNTSKNKSNKSTEKVKETKNAKKPKKSEASEKTQSKKKAPSKKDDGKKAKPAAKKKAVTKAKLVVNTPANSVRKSIGNISTKAGKTRRNRK